MITKDELRKQVSSLIDDCTENDLIGLSVKDTLKDIDCGGIVIYYGNIPDYILNDVF